MDPKVSQFFTEDYDSNWYLAARADVLVAVVTDCCSLAPVGRVVDLGAGTGSILARLVVAGRHAVALETDRRLAAFGHRTHRLPYVVTSLAGGIPLRDHAADLVLLLDVLEHLDDDRSALHEIARVLRPGGRVVVTVPAFQSLWSRHDESHHHKRRYARRSLMDVLEAAGFVCERVTYFNTLLFPLVYLSRRLERILPWTNTASDYEKPPRGISHLLKKIFRLERHLLLYSNLPVGVSLLAIATPSERPDQR